jgi:hypothetical protein
MYIFHFFHLISLISLLRRLILAKFLSDIRDKHPVSRRWSLNKPVHQLSISPCLSYSLMYFIFACIAPYIANVCNSQAQPGQTGGQPALVAQYTGTPGPEQPVSIVLPHVRSPLLNSSLEYTDLYMMMFRLSPVKWLLDTKGQRTVSRARFRNIPVHHLTLHRTELPSPVPPLPLRIRLSIT